MDDDPLLRLVAPPEIKAVMKARLDVIQAQARLRRSIRMSKSIRRGYRSVVITCLFQEEDQVALVLSRLSTRERARALVRAALAAGGGADERK